MAGGALLLTRAGVIIAVGIAALAATVFLMRRPAQPSSDTMPIGGHIDELRRRLIVSLLAWAVATLVAFTTRVGTYAGWPILIPSVRENIASQVFRWMADHLVPDGVQLVVTRPLDGFLAEFTIAAALGILVAGPVLAGQAARFFGPALRPQERRALRRLVAPASLLFVAGAAFAWLWIIPFILRALYGYAGDLGAQPLLQVSELVSFAVLFSILFGVAFQMPLVMFGLARGGVVGQAAFLRYWRHAILGIVIVSALVTDPTVISQLMVAGPLAALYGAGIIAAGIGGRRRQ